MRVHLTLKSSNKKTGPIPVSTTSAETCPKDCPFNHNNIGGCYASYGPLAIHWKKVTSGERGDRWIDFCMKINDLPLGQFWRHNQAGDLPTNHHQNRRISELHLTLLIAANAGKKGFTYTHHTMSLPSNRLRVRKANQYGFTINLSGNNLTHADKLFDYGVGPVTTVLPSVKAEERGKIFTPGGRRVVLCPAVTHDISCDKCRLCSIAERKIIIGFPAHGTGAKKANKVAEGDKV